VYNNYICTNTYYKYKYWEKVELERSNTPKLKHIDGAGIKIDMSPMEYRAQK
jgi:hypothetical protein